MNRAGANPGTDVLVVVIPNIITDIYLLSIPLPVSGIADLIIGVSYNLDLFANDILQLLWRVNISLRRKLTLMVLFSGAAFIMMAGIIRAVVISTVSPPSVTPAK